MNLKIAKALGLDVSWFLQQRADEVIGMDRVLLQCIKVATGRVKRKSASDCRTIAIYEYTLSYWLFQAENVGSQFFSLRQPFSDQRSPMARGRQ